MSAARGVPADVSLHEHACFEYDDERQVHRPVAEYIARGLAGHEKVCVTTGTGVLDGALSAQLRALGVEVEARLAAGELVLDRSVDAYLPDGRFDADARLREYAGVVRDAVAEGYAGVRVYAEVDFVLDHAVDLQDWLAYELRADLLAGRVPFAAICAYDARRWPAEALAGAAAVHGRRRRPPELGAFHLHGAPDGVLHLGGEVDAGNAGTVRHLLDSALGDLDVPAVDVSALHFIDMAGLRALAEAQAAVRDGPHPTVRGASATVRRIWQTSAFDRTYPSLVFTE